jgi:hypothetical protein
MRWLAVAAIVLVGLLYARPLKSYIETKHDLAREALTQEARRLGLVRPGEKLFIVKGISAWLKSRASIDR